MLSTNTIGYKLQKLIPLSKKFYYEDYFNNCNNDMKRTW